MTMVSFIEYPINVKSAVITVRRNLEMQQREKSQSDQNVVKYRQDSRSPINQLQPRNIYQHTRQSIEGNQNSLPAQLGANLGAHHLNHPHAEPPRRNCSSSAEITAGVAPSTEDRSSRLVSTPFFVVSRYASIFLASC